MVDTFLTDRTSIAATFNSCDSCVMRIVVECKDEISNIIELSVPVQGPQNVLTGFYLQSREDVILGGHILHCSPIRDVPLS